MASRPTLRPPWPRSCGPRRPRSWMRHPRPPNPARSPAPTLRPTSPASPTPSRASPMSTFTPPPSSPSPPPSTVPPPPPPRSALPPASTRSPRSSSRRTSHSRRGHLRGHLTTHRLRPTGAPRPTSGRHRGAPLKFGCRTPAVGLRRGKQERGWRQRSAPPVRSVVVFQSSSAPAPDLFLRRSRRSGAAWPDPHWKPSPLQLRFRRPRVVLQGEARYCKTTFPASRLHCCNWN